MSIDYAVQQACNVFLLKITHNKFTHSWSYQLPLSIPLHDRADVPSVIFRRKASTGKGVSAAFCLRQRPSMRQKSDANKLI